MPKFRVNLNGEDSWWEDNKGAFIFFGGVAVLLIFVGFPWLVGCARIVQWIL